MDQILSIQIHIYNWTGVYCFLIVALVQRRVGWARTNSAQNCSLVKQWPICHIGGQLI